MSTRPNLTVLLALVALSAVPLACSLIVDFDPAGKPCGNGGACLPGYQCKDNVCVSGGDGTNPGEPDGGETGCGGRCTGTQKCLVNRDECVEAGCSAVVCPVGSVCKDNGGQTSCESVAKGIGAACSKDEDCSPVATVDAGTGSPDMICVLSSAVSNSGRKGFCSMVCRDNTPGDFSVCHAAGEVPTDCFQINGADLKPVRLCLPVAAGSPETSPRPAYAPCRRSKDCADFPGKVCALFDARTHKDGTGVERQLLVSPPLFCDDAVSGGVKTPTECDPTGPAYAENGLCIPGSTTGHPNARVTAQPCDTVDDCPDAAKTCAGAEFAQHDVLPTTSADFVPRRFDMCIASSHRCQKCTDDSECGPDSPHCISMGTAIEKFCTNECRVLPALPGAGNAPIPFGCDSTSTCRVTGTAATGPGMCIPGSACK